VVRASAKDLQIRSFSAPTGTSSRAVAHWVDGDALADWRVEKDLQIVAFFEAADGIRTHDLLHGKQNVSFLFGADIPCKHGCSRV
jgi:hypothetical protein